MSDRQGSVGFSLIGGFNYILDFHITTNLVQLFFFFFVTLLLLAVEIIIILCSIVCFIFIQCKSTNLFSSFYFYNIPMWSFTFLFLFWTQAVCAKNIFCLFFKIKFYHCYWWLLHVSCDLLIAIDELFFFLNCHSIFFCQNPLRFYFAIHAWLNYSCWSAKNEATLFTRYCYYREHLLPSPRQLV